MRRFAAAVWPMFIGLMLAVSLGAAVPMGVAAQDDDEDDRGSRRRAVGDLIVTLTDSEQRSVAGACFQLVDAQAQVVAESCDTQAGGDRRPNNGRTGFFGVPAGTYMLRLVRLSSGIQPVDIRPVEVKRNRETNEAVTIIIAGEVEEPQQTPVPTIPVTPTATEPTATQPPANQPPLPDEPNVGTLIVTLRDDSGSRTALACFELTNASSESFIRCDTAEFDIYPANGNTGFIDVPADTYTLRLIEAPGVVRFDTWEVTVAANTETRATVSANTEGAPEAPDEGEESEANDADDVEEDDDDRRANQAIVRLVDGVDPVAFANQNGFTLLRSIPGRNVHLLGLNTTVSDDDEVTDLDKDDGTEWAEFNFTSEAPEGRPRRFFTSGERSAPMAADQPAPAVLDLDGE